MRCHGESTSKSFYKGMDRTRHDGNIPGSAHPQQRRPVENSVTADSHVGRYALLVIPFVKFGGLKFLDAAHVNGEIFRMR